MKKFFLNSLGFSLVQGMIVAGVVAGSALVGTRLLTDQKLAQKGAQTRDQIEDLHNVVYTILQDRQNCTQTMFDNSLNTTLGASTGTDPITVISKAGIANPVFLADQNYMNGNIRIDSINLLPPITSSGIRDLDIRYTRFNVDERTKVGYGGKDFKKTIKIRIQKDINNNFTACYAVAAEADGTLINDLAKEMCTEMNISAGERTIFKWDEARSFCKPTGSCPYGEIYTGFDSLGHAKCRKLEDWIDFNEIIDTSLPTGCAPGQKVRLRVNNASKTVKVECF